MLRRAAADLRDTGDQYPQADAWIADAPNLRMRLVGKYSHFYCILFTIDGDEVLVHRVRHASQDSLTEDDF